VCIFHLHSCLDPQWTRLLLKPSNCATRPVAVIHGVTLRTAQDFDLLFSSCRADKERTSIK
jgi:hypothetical protein